jgi:hypothetical protein
MDIYIYIFSFRFNMAKNILEGTQFVIPNAKKFAFPCLIVHGEKDMVTNYHDSVVFYN